MKIALAKDLRSFNAEFSDCMRYRYSLVRQWDATKLMCNWLMLNPSIATADGDDPTVAKIQRYSRRWGFGGAIVTNLFAFRATDPKEMLAAADPVGPDNDFAIVDCAMMAGRVICAWGVHGSHRDRDAAVIDLLYEANVEPYCLAVTKGGQPGHPLYLKGTLDPVPFSIAA